MIEIMSKFNKFIYKFLRYSGLPFLFREFKQKNKVTILMFHDINEKTSERLFRYLKKRYNIIDLNFFINACENKEAKKLPPKSLIITFDDGHAGNYRMLPVLKKYKIPITIFLCTGIINTKRHYWFKYPLLSRPSEDYKSLSNKERINELLKIGFEEMKEYSEVQALNKDQIEEMSEFVNFQSHTKFHPCLPTCSDTEAFDELSESRKFLEKEYKFSINSIAYPNGDYNEKIMSIARKSGYKCGLTIDYGFNNIYTNLLGLKRLSVNDTVDMNEFIVKSSGVWGYFKNALN